MHVMALLKGLAYMILWFDYNVMPKDVVNVIVSFGNYF